MGGKKRTFRVTEDLFFVNSLVSHGLEPGAALYLANNAGERISRSEPSSGYEELRMSYVLEDGQWDFDTINSLDNALMKSSVVPRPMPYLTPEEDGSLRASFSITYPAERRSGVLEGAAAFGNAVWGAVGEELACGRGEYAIGPEGNIVLADRNLLDSLKETVSKLKSYF